MEKSGIRWKHSQVCCRALADFKLIVNLGNYLEEVLRDCFVCGLRYTKAALSRNRFNTGSCHWHCKEYGSSRWENAATIRSKKADSTEVNKLKCNSTPAQSCYCCDKPDHTPSTCHFKEGLCRKCGKKARIAKVW